MYVESKYKKAGVLFILTLIAMIAVYVYGGHIEILLFDTKSGIEKMTIITNAIGLIIIAVSLFVKFHIGVVVAALLIAIPHILLLVNDLNKIIEWCGSIGDYIEILDGDNKIYFICSMAYYIMVPLSYIILSISLFANTAAQRKKVIASFASIFMALGVGPRVVFWSKYAVEYCVEHSGSEHCKEISIYASIILIGAILVIVAVLVAAGAYIVKAKEYRRMNHQEDMYSQDAYNTDSNNTYGGSRYYNPASAHPQSTDTTQTAQTTQTGPKFYTPFANDSASTDEVAEQGYYNPNATVDNNNFDPYAPIDK